MAQIFAFGRVENDLVPKKSQKDSTYVCFGLLSRQVRASSSITRYGHGMMKYPALPGLVSKRTAGCGSPAHSSWWTVPQAMERNGQKS